QVRRLDLAGEGRVDTELAVADLDVGEPELPAGVIDGRGGGGDDGARALDGRRCAGHEDTDGRSGEGMAGEAQRGALIQLPDARVARLESNRKRRAVGGVRACDVLVHHARPR